MHISEEQFEQFENSSMDTEEMLAFLEHIEHCNYCMEHMLHQESTSPAVQAPQYLRDQILTKATTPAVQADKTIRTASYRMQLFYYGLKTAAGVVMALLLLFTVTEVDFAGITPSFHIQQELPERSAASPKTPNYLQDLSRKINRNLNEGSEALTGYINELSNKIINGGR